MAVSPVSSVSPDTSSSGSRFTWMDLFRGLAVVLVTANHAADESTSEAIRGVMAALGDYRMPALLLLSGILLPRSLTKPTGVFISGKLRLIAWPCLVWSAVMLGIFGPELGLTWRWWLLAEPSHVWYLNALLMYYLLGLLLRRVPPSSRLSPCSPSRSPWPSSPTRGTCPGWSGTGPGTASSSSSEQPCSRTCTG